MKPTTDSLREGMGWVAGLDALRFLLAMVVFLSHLENTVASYLKSFDSIFIWFLGVIYNHAFLGPGAVVGFFIISGFVIHYPVKSKTLNIKSFLTRRWLRIGLPLITIVLISSALGKFRLIPIWSLYCELIYYTIYPLLRRSKISWSTQISVSLGIAAILILVYGQNEIRSMVTQSSIEYTGSYASLGDGLTWLIGLPPWLMGVWLAERIDQKSLRISLTKMNFVRLGVFVLAAVILALKAHWFVSYLLTLNIFAFPLTYWIEREIRFFKHHRPWTWLEKCGSFSYSLYLLHGVCTFYLGNYFGATLLTYPLIIALTLCISYIFFVLIERPSHHIARRIGNVVESRWLLEQSK